MTSLKSYTLKYYCLGSAIKGNNFRVYLRYYVTLDSKPVSLSLNTAYTLTKEQVELLNKNELGGAIQQDLNKVKANIIQIIEGLNIQFNSYPTPDQLKDWLSDSQNVLPMEKYISDFLKSLETKKSSKYIYSLRLKQFKDYYDLNLTKTPLTTLVNKTTVETYGEWLKRQYAVRDNKKPLGKAYLHDLKSSAIRLLNFVAEQQKIPPIPFYLKSPKYSEQYTPTEIEFEKLISIDCNGIIKLVQEMMYINSFLGIRIAELLSITPESVRFNGDHVEIHFSDFKHSKARDIILMDDKAIGLLKKHIANAGDTIYNISADVFNRNLKKLAELAFKEKKVTLYNTDLDENATYLIKDVITSHCIRRYAIINNIAKYGIDVAKTFSGHTNYHTVERHYAKDFMNKNASLNILRRVNSKGNL